MTRSRRRGATRIPLGRSAFGAAVRVALAFAAFAAVPAFALALAAPPVAAAIPRDAVGSLAFPRTALWWPSASLPVSGLARYDLLVLHDYERVKVAEVHRLHPDEVVLDSGNACELPYDPESFSANAALRRVPAQWVLTQVGSTLAAPVAASASVFRVAAVTGPGGLVLFKAGDTVVVDGEIAYVLAVDATARTLNVRRGAVNAAASHSAGARIAAAVSYYARDLVMDVSTNCPRITAEAAVGPEDWATYNARTCAALLSSADWDGILIDRTDANGSWVVGYSSARSIDPGRANVKPADYRSFDAQWNEGLRAFESELRQRAGEKLVLGNWAMPNLDLLDGNVFEAFPKNDGTSYNGTWRQTAFGPLNGYGGLAEWASGARQPAVDLVATYDEDDPPASTPLPALAAVRKARFGLGTALLGGAFFTYQYNPDGRGSSALSWFDTFDGAGLGRGYLGLPSAPATVAVPPLTTPDLLTRGDFATAEDLSAWDVFASAGYAASRALVQASSPAGGSCALVSVDQAAGTAWRASFTRAGVGAITAGREYTVSFWAKADGAHDVSVWLQGDRDDTRTLAEFGEVSLDGAWRRYEVSVRAAASSGSAGTRLHFGLGRRTGDVWLDGVHVREGTTSVWRRDYAGGIVLVNASSVAVTVQLGDTYRALRGTQDPAVDDGQLRSSLTISPLDARILIRPAVQALPRLDEAESLWRRAAARAEAARRRTLASRARTTRAQRARLAVTASVWGRARDACYAALAAEQSAREAALAGDDAATSAAMDAAVSAGKAAVRATSVRDPLRTREGIDARRAAASAYAAVIAAHGILP